MISNFWKSVEKWQKRFMEVCNDCEVSWFSWFISCCCHEGCGYCIQFYNSGTVADDKCKTCLLYKQNVCVMDCDDKPNALFWKLRRACADDDCDKILVLTYQILEAVSNPDNMKYFMRRSSGIC